MDEARCTPPGSGPGASPCRTSSAGAWRRTALAPEKEFFIRKAIGWALRDCTRGNPQAVRGFVAEQRPRLSALSVGEALKHLKPADPG